MHVGFWTKAAAGIGLSLAIAGCGSEVVTESRSAMLDAVLDGDAMRVEALVVEESLVFEDRLVTCMLGEGFEYKAVDEHAELQMVSEFYYLVQGGGSDESAPVASGFRTAWEAGLFAPSGEATGTGAAEFNLAYSQDLEPAAQQAYAAAIDGCYQSEGADIEALVQLEDEARALLAEIDQRVTADSLYTNLFAQWHRCIEEEGYGDLPELLEDIDRFFVDRLMSQLRSMEEVSEFGPAIDEFAGYERNLRSTVENCDANAQYSSGIAEVRDAVEQELLG